jgi:hypothetical protein
MHRQVLGKAVHPAALDEHGLAGGHIYVLSINPPGRDTAYSIDHLVPAIVIVGDRHARVPAPDGPTLTIDRPLKF